MDREVGKTMHELYSDAGQPDVMIVCPAPDLVDLTEVVRAAGGRALARPDWTDLHQLEAADTLKLILVAASGVEEALLTDALSTIARIASRQDVAVVVTLDDEQIDMITAQLFGPQIDLLCRPTTAALTAAVAVGLARRGGILADSVREREAERLRQLNEEVARIADVLARLASSADRKPGTIADRALDYRPPPAVPPAIAASDIRKAIRARRLRDQQFPGMLEDPAWDMLLDLYAADLEGTQVSVSSLCIAAAVPATTALRWIGRMTEAGLLERQPDPFDRRRAFMVLTADGRDRMQRYFAALAQNGLHIA